LGHPISRPAAATDDEAALPVGCPTLIVQGDRDTLVRWTSCDESR